MLFSIIVMSGNTINVVWNLVKKVPPPAAAPRTEPSAQQKYGLHIFLSLLNFCQSGFLSLCLPFTSGSSLWGDTVLEPQPKNLLMREFLHWYCPLAVIWSTHSWFSPLETSKMSRQIPFFHPETNCISSLCRSNYYYWTEKKEALFYLLGYINVSFLLDCNFLNLTRWQTSPLVCGG